MDSTSLLLDGPVINNAGAQVYFDKATTQHPAFPLEPGDEWWGYLFPDTAIVLFPGERELEPGDDDWPVELTLHDPAEYSFRATPEQSPENGKSPTSNPGGERL
jgi:hypothetical protein